MKIGFISDTHGGLEETVEAINLLKDCDNIIHLGDVLYHGPRNALPKTYNPKELAVILSKIDNIKYVKGNCDSDVDQMVTGKDMSQKNRIFDFGKLKIYAVHGYEESEEDRIKKAKENNCNLIVTGHTHIKVLKKVDDIFILNPGSTTIPKDGTKSVAIFDGEKLKHINLDTKEIIDEINID